MFIEFDAEYYSRWLIQANSNKQMAQTFYTPIFPILFLKGG